MPNIFEKEVEAASGQMEYDDSFDASGLDAESQEQLRQVEALARMDESFANSQEYQDLMKSLNSSRQAASKDNDDDEDEYDDEEEEVDPEDIFGVMKTQKQKEVQLTFQPTKEMIGFLNNHYGIKDASTFFSSVDTWRQQAQQGSEIEKNFDALTADLQALPPEIKTAVELWANGDDHMAAFEMTERLDFSSDFAEQDVESLVQHYLPEEYDELAEAYENGEIDDEELEDKMILLAKTTRRLFSGEKQALDEEREEFLERQKNEFQTMKKSALLSADNLSKAYPNFSKSEVSKIRSILVEGKVDSLFMKPDGSYNDDAAELVAYAVYGKKMLDSVRKVAERSGESKANQKIVDSSPKSVRKQQSSGTMNPAGMEGYGHLSGVFKNDPYA
jgi:hypothetical protein